MLNLGMYSSLYYITRHTKTHDGNLSNLLTTIAIFINTVEISKTFWNKILLLLDRFVFHNDFFHFLIVQMSISKYIEDNIVMEIFDKIDTASF